MRTSNLDVFEYILTHFEWQQADGFQLMLDLGLTEEEIKKRIKEI